MIDFTQLFCSQTDRALSDLKEQDIERLQFSLFCAMAEEFGYDLVKLTKLQSDKIESVCLGNAWIHHGLSNNVIYAPPCNEPEVELTIEFNPEVDHFDLEGNFVKGIPND